VAILSIYWVYQLTGYTISLSKLAKNPFAPGTATPSIQLQSNVDHTAPPAWALSLFAEIQTIKTEVVKIDKIDKSVNEIKIKMTEMETNV